MALGATLGGLLADRFGRRQVFALTLLVFGLATGAAALSWSVGALLVFRFLIGLGLGAELPVASTLVSEFAPARVRGRVVVLLEAFWAVGWTLAALIGYFVVPRSDAGWRWALALGALPALYAVVVRRGLPESVRFLETARARPDEAEAAVRRFEAAAGVDAGALAAAGRRRRRPARGRSGRPACGPDGGAVDRLVQHQLRLLRRLHLAADPAGGRGLLAGPVVRVHAGHHAGPAARATRSPRA